MIKDKALWQNCYLAWQFFVPRRAQWDDQINGALIFQVRRPDYYGGVDHLASNNYVRFCDNGGYQFPDYYRAHIGPGLDRQPNGLAAATHRADVAIFARSGNEDSRKDEKAQNNASSWLLRIFHARKKAQQICYRSDATMIKRHFIFSSSQACGRKKLSATVLIARNK